MRLVFGTAAGAATEVDDPSAVVDAEYLFLAGEARFLGFGDARGRTFTFALWQLNCNRGARNERRRGHRATCSDQLVVIGFWRFRLNLSCAMADDNIVVLRAASRAEPPAGQGNLSLSFSKGFVFDSNIAGRSLERLRKA